MYLTTLSTGVRCVSALLRAGYLVAQALVLCPQRRDLGRLRFDHVAQQVQDVPCLRVRDPT